MFGNLGLESFVGSTDFGNGSDDKLGRHGKFCPDGVIRDLLKLEFAKGPMEKRNFSQTIADIPVGLTGFCQQLLGVFVCSEFEFQHKFHGSLLPDKRIFVKSETHCKASLEARFAIG